MSYLYNKLIENIILPAGDIALGTAYMKQLRDWREIQFKNAAQLHAIQKERLAGLLSYASEKAPFYKNLNIPENQDPFARIKNFPVMTKKIIKEKMDGLVLKDRDSLIKLASSGSSGIQGVVYMDKMNQSNQLAAQTLWWEWSGYKLGNSILQTGITPNRGKVKATKDFLLNTLYVSAYNLDQAEVLNILKGLQKKPRQHFMGYASSLFVFAKVAEENGINDIHFDSVVSWGDKMFPHFRTFIEKQFHTTVFDTYGCSEGFMIAGECPAHNYHIMTPLVYLEILNDNGNDVAPGELGNVVVTRLDNYAMPLIRYYLGDLAIVDEPSARCSCGRELPLLKKVIGRDTDIVKTRSGKFMVVHAFTGIFEHIPEIKQFKVVQNDLDSIDIEYIKDNGFTEQVLDQVREKINGYLHENFPVHFKEVDHIAPTPSGKPQIIQSFLKQSKAQTATA
jgi:phenylacetate-CoA ligase